MITSKTEKILASALRIYSQVERATIFKVKTPYGVQDFDSEFVGNTNDGHSVYVTTPNKGINFEVISVKTVGVKRYLVARTKSKIMGGKNYDKSHAHAVALQCVEQSSLPSDMFILDKPLPLK